MRQCLVSKGKKHLSQTPKDTHERAEMWFLTGRIVSWNTAQWVEGQASMPEALGLSLTSPKE